MPLEVKALSRAALTKLWSFFALTTLSLSFLFFLRTTGVRPGSDTFGILGHNALTIPILALPINMALFAIVLWLTWEWSKSVHQGSWSQRIPLFYFEEKDIQPLTRGGRIYQRWSFSLTMVVPMLLTLQMADRFFGGAVFGRLKECEKDAILVKGLGMFTEPKLHAAVGLLRFGDADGPQFFAIQPWVYAGSLAALVFFWLLVLTSIFRRG